METNQTTLPLRLRVIFGNALVAAAIIAYLLLLVELFWIGFTSDLMFLVNPLIVNNMPMILVNHVLFGASWLSRATWQGKLFAIGSLLLTSFLHTGVAP